MKEKSAQEQPVDIGDCPAFPTFIHGENATILGMSLRDWFAGMAMQRILNVAGDAMANADPDGVTGIDRDIARISYRMAEAMLRARKRKV